MNAATFLQLCEANATLSDAFTSRVALSDAERAACAALSMNLQPVPTTHFDDDRALRATLPPEDRAACAAMQGGAGGWYGAVAVGHPALNRAGAGSPSIDPYA